MRYGYQARPSDRARLNRLSAPLARRELSSAVSEWDADWDPDWDAPAKPTAASHLATASNARTTTPGLPRDLSPVVFARRFLSRFRVSFFSMIVCAVYAGLLVYLRR